MINNVEIMSPVGSYESLHAAIQAGAGSVYFGAGNLNMRSKSSYNFTLDDLQNIVDICIDNNVKSYLAVNTVIYDNEINEVEKILKIAKEKNVSAIIASDMAVINKAYELGHDVHISTQLNVSNVEALKFFSRFANVVVLARELNLEQVKHIASIIKEQNITGPNGRLVQLEMFVHGALCMAVSGKCYLSLHETNHSANRGACLQTCRKAYNVTEKQSGYQLEVDNEYIMSPKDLMTIHFLNKILDAGVTVLKIEGRGRSPEYVKTVTQCYKEAVDAYLKDDYTEERINDWKERLSTVFNRGFWDGYYLGQKLGEWSHKYGSQAKKRKIYIAKATNYFKNRKVAEFKLQSHELNTGDEILIIGPTTGVVESKVEEIRVDRVDETIISDNAQKGEIFSIKTPEPVRRGDKLYKRVDASKIKQQ